MNFVPAAPGKAVVDLRVFRGEAYDPAIMRVGVDVGTGYYRHIPTIAVKNSTQILAAYTYNPSSASESAAGQLVGFRRSSDDGANWSSLANELNSSAYATNPLDPSGDGAIQTESFVLYDAGRDEEIAALAHRAGSYEACFIAFRDGAGADPSINRWTNYRLRWNATTNAVSPSASDVTGAADAGFKLTCTIDGVEYDAVPSKPVIATDGRLVLPVLFLTTFGSAHRVGFVVWSADRATVSMGGIVPLGDVGPGDAWEPMLWQAGDGSWRCQVRDNSGASPSAHAISVSADLCGWSPFEHADTDLHLNRHVRIRVSDELYLGIGTSDDSARNNMALFASGDGECWVHGTTLSAEIDGTDFVHYGDLAVAGGKVYVLYSQEDTESTAPAPNEIHFARLSMVPGDGRLPVMATDKNRFELGSGASPSFSGNELTVPPRMMASMPSRGKRFLLTVRAKVSAAPGTYAYRIVSVGDAVRGYFSIEYRDDSGAAKLYANGVEIGTVSAPTEYASFQVAVDLERGLVSAFGQQAEIGRWARIYFGDIDTDAGGAQTGNIVVDCDDCYLAEFSDLPPGVGPDAWNATFAALTAATITANGNIAANDGDVTSHSNAADVNMVADSGANKISNFRWRAGGATKAVAYYHDQTDTWALQVEGTNVLEINGGEAAHKIPQNFEDSIAAKGFFGFGAPDEVTISSGAITVTRSYHIVDTEGGTASDVLHTINGGRAGDVLVLKTVSSNRDVVVKHATGNIYCGADRTLNTVSDTIILINRGGASWDMVSYADN